MDPTPRPALGAPGLVGRTVTLLLQNFGFLFPLAFVPALVLALLGALVGPAAEPVDPQGLPALPGMGEVLVFAAAFLVDVVLGFLVTGVMCLAAIDAVIGKRHAVGEYIAQTLRHLAPIVALGALLYVFAGVGFVVFVLPGLYILARFLPWVPAIVFENAGWSGLTRAQELTEGYRWPLVGAFLLFVLLSLGLAVVVVPLAALGANGGVAVFVLIQALVTAIYYALVAVFSALVYARLRAIKEGMSTADLAASID